VTIVLAPVKKTAGLISIAIVKGLFAILFVGYFAGF